MKRSLMLLLALGLVVASAGASFAQSRFYCVKPDGTPLAAIVMPYGDNHDPSVVCNAAVPQCFLTCAAVSRVRDGVAVTPDNVPTVTVTPQMLANIGGGAAETPAFCAQQYDACVAHCRGDRSCIGYCQSVRSGCGTGNRGQ